jgi:hypothetical protein
MILKGNWAVLGYSVAVIDYSRISVRDLDYSRISVRDLLGRAL